MAPQVCLPVTDSSHVGEVRRTATRLAQAAGLSESKRSDAAIVATELATNLNRHATHGRVYLQALSSPSGTSLELIAVDEGPGIRDLHRCLQDGYSSGGTSGTGFGAVRRLSAEFDAFSTVGRGTVVVARISAGPSSSAPTYALGALSVPAPREHVCGDSWSIVERGSQLAVMVADGLGHGPLAAEAAARAASVFQAQPFVEPTIFYGEAHRALAGSRGAAVARAVLDPTGRVEYSGVGNIAASLIGVQGSRGLPSQNGTVGAEMRRQIAANYYDWPERGVLLMHSDGIVGRWSFDPYPGLLIRHPAVIAAIVCRDFLRGRDDATVVVVSRPAKAAVS